MYTTKKDYSSNLIANYKMDETTGTICIDSINNNSTYNGTYNGTTSITDSYGTYRSFNGKSDYISFSNRIIPIGKKSIQFNIKLKSYPSSGGIFRIIDTAYSDSSWRGILIRINDNGTLSVISCNCGDRFVLTSTMALQLNQWNTILFTWDGTINSNTAKLFINNLAIPNITATANSIETIQMTFNLVIGKSAEFNEGFSNMCINNLKIYNDAIEYNPIEYLIQDGNNLDNSDGNGIYIAGSLPYTTDIFNNYGMNNLFNVNPTSISKIINQKYNISMLK